MLLNLTRIIYPTPYLHNVLLNTIPVVQQQSRTTFIVKRKVAPLLAKKGAPPKRLRARHFIYQLVKDVNIEKKPPLSLILTEYVEKLGNPGDKVEVSHHYGYNQLLLPGRATYASPENIEKYKDYKSATDEVTHSSPYAQKTAELFSRVLLSVVMSKDNPWILQPWHIRVAFRKCGYTVPEKAITMPSKPVQGPDTNLQDKEFVIMVTINNLETAKVRCRIHHWSTDVTERIPHVHEFWKESPGCVFVEDESILNSLPKKTAKQDS